MGARRPARLGVAAMSTGSFTAAGALLASSLVAAACGLDWYVPTDDGAGSSGQGGDPRGGATWGIGSGTGPSTSGSASVSSSASTAGGAGGTPTSGSTSGSTTGPSSVASTGSGPPPSCDQGGCDPCTECSLARGCQGELDACHADASCGAFDACLGECGNDSFCIDGCYYDYWEGAAPLFTAMAQCVICDDCQMTCSEYAASWGC